MLEVLARRPVAAPLEAFLDEELVAKVVVVYLVGEGLCAVAILHSCGGLHIASAVFTVFVVGGVERVDVHSQSACVFRELAGAAGGASRRSTSASSPATAATSASTHSKPVRPATFPHIKEYRADSRLPDIAMIIICFFFEMLIVDLQI